jgi:hypothetical protein
LTTYQAGHYLAGSCDECFPAYIFASLTRYTRSPTRWVASQHACLSGTVQGFIFQSLCSHASRKKMTHIKEEDTITLLSTYRMLAPITSRTRGLLDMSAELDHQSAIPSNLPFHRPSTTVGLHLVRKKEVTDKNKHLLAPSSANHFGKARSRSYFG